MRKQSTHRGVVRLTVILCVFGVLATVLSAWISALATPIGRSVFLVYDGEWIDGVPEEWPDSALTVSYIASDILQDPPLLLRPIAKFLPASMDLPRSSRLRVHQGFGQGVSSSPTGIEFLGEDPLRVVEQIRTGWPINTMVVRGPNDSRPEVTNGLMHVYQNGVVVSGAGTWGVRAIPLQPRWDAFTISVIGWAMIAWVGVLGYRLTKVGRRRRWRRLGLCVGCGYAIEDLGVCPECGQTVSDQAAA